MRISLAPALVLMLVAANCGPVPAPRPPTGPIARTVALTVTPAEARGTLALDNGQAPIAGRNDGGHLVFTVPISVVDGWHARIHLEADGYVVIDRDVAIAGELEAVTLELLPPAWPRAFSAERGRVHGCAYLFCLESGDVWDWRGDSMYRLFGRYLAGEDITGDLHALWKYGVNVLRVWTEQDGGANRTYDRPDFDAQLGAFVDLVAAYGLRLELTAITEYRRPFDEDVRTLQRVYDVAAGRWNVFVEVVNEPWNGGAPDPVALAARVNRRGVPSAYGLDPAHEADQGDRWSCSYSACPHLEYVTTHLPRDLDRYFRNAKDVEEMRGLGVPVVDDEPLGIAEYNRVGAGARSTDMRAHVSHFGVARLYAAGATIHSQAGLEGRTPRADEPITDQIMMAISAVWQAIPAAAAAGLYVRAPGGGDGGDFGLVVTREDLYEGRGYGAIVGDRQYVVLPQSAAYPVRVGFVPIPRPGWGQVAPLEPAAFYQVTR